MKKTYKIFLLVILALTMYNNLDHSAHVYHDVALPEQDQNMYGWIQSYLVVIVIDLSVIAFIIAGRITESAIFAWILFFINLIFFDVLDTAYQAYISENPQERLELFRKILAKVFFSGIFSYFIHRFSVLFYEERNQHAFVTQIDTMKKELDQREKTNTELQEMISLNSMKVDTLTTENELLQAAVVAMKKENYAIREKAIQLHNKVLEGEILRTRSEDRKKELEQQRDKIEI